VDRCSECNKRLSMSGSSPRTRRHKQPDPSLWLCATCGRAKALGRGSGAAAAQAKSGVAMTQSEIAERLGLSVWQVREAERSAKEKLRASDLALEVYLHWTTP
jgi:hypothetical protein